MTEPLRVLIADDEADVRLLLAIQLADAGFAIAGHAGDGEEVLRCCDSVDVDVVVLDLLMPGMNGFEVIPALRRAHPRIGMVAYTAVAGDFVRREMARLRIPLVLKSGDVTTLAKALRSVAGGVPARGV